MEQKQQAQMVLTAATLEEFAKTVNACESKIRILDEPLADDLHQVLTVLMLMRDQAVRNVDSSRVHTSQVMN